MQHLIITLLLLLVSTATVYADQQQTITIGTEGAYPPFNQTDIDGSLSGFDIDIGDALCAQMQVECHWIVVDWNSLIPSLIAKKIDAIVSAMSITEARKVKVHFTDGYYLTPLGLVAPRQSNLMSNPKVLVGKRIGVSSATVADSFIAQFWSQQQIEVVRYDNDNLLYNALVAGNIDAFLHDAITTDSSFLRSEAGKNFAFAGDLITGVNSAEREVIGEGFGIAVRKEDENLRIAFNKALTTIIEDGRYETILQKYFSYNMY